MICVYFKVYDLAFSCKFNFQGIVLPLLKGSWSGIVLLVLSKQNFD